MIQWKRMLQYMLENDSITSWEGMLELGVMDVPKRICELQNEGIKIRKEWIKSTNRYGDKITFRKYSLIKD